MMNTGFLEEIFRVRSRSLSEFSFLLWSH
jgi:hypothetical protein